MLLGTDVYTHVSVFLHWPDPHPQFLQKLRQPQNPGVPVVMDIPSGGENCEELKRIPPRELYVPRYQRVKQQLGLGGMGLPECDLALRE